MECHWILLQKPVCHKIGKYERNGRFLDKYHIPKLNQDQVNYLNRPISREELKAVIKNLPTKKSPGPDSFKAEFYQNFQEELIAILLNVLHKIETEESSPNSSYEATIT